VLTDGLMGMAAGVSDILYMYLIKTADQTTRCWLKIKEAIHIQWKKPTLNHQLYRVNLELSL